MSEYSNKVLEYSKKNVRIFEKVLIYFIFIKMPWKKFVRNWYLIYVNNITKFVFILVM